MESTDFKTDTYTTPARELSALTRLLPSFAFYSRFVFIVLSAARAAKHGPYPRTRWGADSQAVLNLMERVGGRFEISGFDNIRRLGRSCVIVANHMSTLETTAFPFLFLPFGDVAFVVKQSLCDYPVFGHVMRAVDPIAVTRTKPREDLKLVLEKGTEMLQSGRSVIIFPQTTRSLTFDPAEFNTIGVKLALKAGAPIIPVAIKTDFWGHGSMLKDFGKMDPSKTIHMAIGEPMTITGRGNEEHQRALEFITSKLKSWEG